MRRSLIALLLAAVAVPSGGRAGLITQDPCPGAAATVDVFKHVGNPSDVLENLGFDGLGSMWVSDSTSGQIQKYDASGTLQTFFPVASPGAIQMGPDGLMYANVGDGAAGAILRTGQAGVIRFDPSQATPSPSVFASGLNMANGGAFDAAGNLYVSNDFDVELTKIIGPLDPDANKRGTIDKDWTAAADVWGTNGLIVTGDSLYSAITFDQRSGIERIPLDAPQSHASAKKLTLGVVTLQPAVYTTPPDTTAPLVGLKGLDDMTLSPDGTQIYVVANGMGELLRIDLTPDGTLGDACLVASGLQNPSSVRFSAGFGSNSDTSDLFITEFSGTIRQVHLP